MGSDSGRIVILEFDSEKNMFEKTLQETFGKTGCRRIVPGQHIACDPKGRAIMISAVEKQKFVYILNRYSNYSRDANTKLTISSPLEAHKSHTLVYDTCSVDVGYENPLFAVLEVDYGDTDQPDATINTGEYEKILTFYEMYLGLNHVIRKQAEPLPKTAHMLIPGCISN